MDVFGPKTRHFNVEKNEVEAIRFMIDTKKIKAKPDVQFELNVGFLINGQADPIMFPVSIRLENK